VNAVLCRIPDPERRAALLSRVLALHPKAKSNCCAYTHCYRCKTKGFHDGVSCDANQGWDRGAEQVVTCHNCGVWIVKGDGCSSINCVCGANFNWDTRVTQMGDAQVAGFRDFFTKDPFRIAYEFVVRGALGERVASKQLLRRGFVPTSAVALEERAAVTEQDSTAALRFIQHHVSVQNAPGSDPMRLAAVEAEVWETHCNRMIAQGLRDTGGNQHLHEHLAFIRSCPSELTSLIPATGVPGAYGLDHAHVLRLRQSWKGLNPASERTIFRTLTQIVDEHARDGLPSRPSSPPIGAGRPRLSASGEAFMSSYAAGFECLYGTEAPRRAYKELAAIMHLPDLASVANSLVAARGKASTDTLVTYDTQMPEGEGNKWSTFAERFEDATGKGTLPSEVITEALANEELGPHGPRIIVQRAKHLRFLLTLSPSNRLRSQLSDLESYVQGIADQAGARRCTHASIAGANEGLVDVDTLCVSTPQLIREAAKVGFMSLETFEWHVREEIIPITSSILVSSFAAGMKKYSESGKRGGVVAAPNTHASMALAYANAHPEAMAEEYVKRYEPLAAQWLELHDGDLLEAAITARRFALVADFSMLRMRSDRVLDGAACKVKSEHYDEAEAALSLTGEERMHHFETAEELIATFGFVEAFAHQYPREYQAALPVAKARFWLHDVYEGDARAAARAALKAMQCGMLKHYMQEVRDPVTKLWRHRRTGAQSLDLKFNKMCVVDTENNHLYGLAANYLVHNLGRNEGLDPKPAAEVTGEEEGAQAEENPAGSPVLQAPPGPQPTFEEVKARLGEPCAPVTSCFLISHDVLPRAFADLAGAYERAGRGERLQQWACRALAREALDCQKLSHRQKRFRGPADGSPHARAPLQNRAKNRNEAGRGKKPKAPPKRKPWV